MKTVLVVDCCIRQEESRTRKILQALLAHLSGYNVERVDLCTMPPQPLNGSFFEERQQLLQNHNLQHPRFHLAHQFAKADHIVMAAPFYDLSFPALLKIYIENVSVDGITFRSGENGLTGICRAEELLFLTTRGGIYHAHEDEQASPYLKALCRFFGILTFPMIDADGMDIVGYDQEGSLADAIRRAHAYARQLTDKVSVSHD